MSNKGARHIKTVRIVPYDDARRSNEVFSGGITVGKCCCRTYNDFSVSCLQGEPASGDVPSYVFVQP